MPDYFAENLGDDPSWPRALHLPAQLAGASSECPPSPRTAHLSNFSQQYLANPPTDPAASQYYQQPPQQPAGQWGPPSAGYSPQPPYGSDMAQAPGSVPMYNAHDERVPSYSGMPVSQMDEKNPFEDVKV